MSHCTFVLMSFMLQTSAAFVGQRGQQRSPSSTRASALAVSNTSIRNGERLFSPFSCILTLSFIRSLVQWLKYSKKEYCELCKHRFAFTPSEFSAEIVFHPMFAFSLLFRHAKALARSRSHWWFIKKRGPWRSVLAPLYARSCGLVGSCAPDRL